MKVITSQAEPFPATQRRSFDIELGARVLNLVIAIGGSALAHMGLVSQLAYLIVIPPMIAACRKRGGLRGWMALHFGLFFFVGFRGVADNLGFPVHTADLQAAERFLFLGVYPSYALQQALYTPGVLSVLDYAAVVVHWSWFLTPYLAMIGIWLVSPRRSDRYAFAMLLTWVLSLACFVFFPATPPWLASRDGVPEVARILTHVGAQVMPQKFDVARGTIGDSNSVAAVPSLHFCLTFLLFLASRQFGWRVSLAAGIYLAAMGFSLTYLGEHYVFDLVVGASIAAAAWMVTRRTGRADGSRDTRGLHGRAGAGFRH